ncbi:energy-converting hydrogenase B subunit EhbP, partial [Streptococcus suis]|nr:energy-converting hydrogenase B subunit EhbP [Streptococcus suis]
MNKQEAINELKKYKVGFGEAAAVRFDRIVSVINQIHEPQKLVVPKFVAEWIEECKRSGWHLEKVLYRLDD